MIKEKIRIWDDGKFQYIVGRRQSRLYDPVIENYPKGDFWRVITAAFSDCADRFHRKRCRFYIDIPWWRAMEWWDKYYPKRLRT